jgi:cell division septal protein FtsQ
MSDYSRLQNYSARSANGRRHRKRRKKKMSLFMVIFSALLFAAAVIVTFTVFFSVRSIQVEGVKRYDSGQIIAASGLNIGDRIFDIDTGTAAAGIKKDLSYVEDAKIKIQLSGALVIKVQETDPAMALMHRGGYVVLSGSMKILQTGMDFAPADIILVNGLELKNPAEGEWAVFDEKYREKAEKLEEIAAYIRDSGFTGEIKLDMHDLMDLKLEYNSHVAVQLGSMSKMARKIANVKTIIDENVPDDAYYIIDAQLEESQKPRIGFRAALSIEDYYNSFSQQFPAAEQALPQQSVPDSRDATESGEISAGVEYAESDTSQ